MILITGATGHLGSATIEHLLKIAGGDNIVALARDEDKAAALKEKGVEVRIGDFEDTASLQNAVRGIEKVLLISTGVPERLQQHKNVVDTAKKAGVKHIVYTSVALNDVDTIAFKLMVSHFQTEDYIRQSGIPYTFLRDNLYADIIPVYVGDNVFETGIYLPAGNGKVPFALRREMGEAAANVLLQSGHENKTYNISANELYSFDDVAEVLSGLSGKKISYTDADASTFVDTLKAAGVPDFLIVLVSEFAADIKNGQYEIVSDDLEKLLGRKPATLKESLKEIYGL